MYNKHVSNVDTLVNCYENSRSYAELMPVMTDAKTIRHEFSGAL